MAKSDDLGRVISVRGDGDERNLDYARQPFRMGLELTFENLNYDQTDGAGHAESPS